MQNKMLHLLVLGQSNVANHCASPAASSFGRVYYAQKFEALRDPVPGGSGKLGSVWTRFAPIIKDSGLASDLVISLKAQGGTSVEDWSEHGFCYDALAKDLPAIQKCPVLVTHVVYHQGERDTLLKTDSQAYFERFLTLHRLVTRALPEAQWIVCRVSYRIGVTSEAVRTAQEQIIANIPSIRPGPDTDLYGDDYRDDRTHLNEAGLAAFAKDLLRCFKLDMNSQGRAR